MRGLLIPGACWLLIGINLYRQQEGLDYTTLLESSWVFLPQSVAQVSLLVPFLGTILPPMLDRQVIVVAPAERVDGMLWQKSLTVEPEPAVCMGEVAAEAEAEVYPMFVFLLSTHVPLFGHTNPGLRSSLWLLPFLPGTISGRGLSRLVVLT